MWGTQEPSRIVLGIEQSVNGDTKIEWVRGIWTCSNLFLKDEGSPLVIMNGYNLWRSRPFLSSVLFCRAPRYNTVSATRNCYTESKIIFRLKKIWCLKTTIISVKFSQVSSYVQPMFHYFCSFPFNYTILYKTGTRKYLVLFLYCYL